VLHPVRLAEFSVNFSYSVDSSLGRVPACHAGGPGSIPGRCSSIFGIWREVLGRNVCIIFIIYRDIISHITITYRYIMYFFRTFKKSTVPYKVHNMGLRYIKYTVLYIRDNIMYSQFLCRSDSFIMFAKNTKNLYNVYKAESDLKYFNVLL
jgi:hypothetical protein